MAETLLPDEVTLEVLAKLCLKSLFRFKSVCKTCFSTISDPQFSTKLHWKPSSALIICQDSRTFSAITIESLLTRGAPLSLPWETEEDRSMQRPRNYLLGSCNGLVCVEYLNQDLILWNPSTGKFRRLPRRSAVRNRFDYINFVGFGYDESTDDYKLVWLDYHRLGTVPGETKTELNVLTLKSNVWRRTYIFFQGLSTVDDDIGKPRIIGVLSNGVIRWHATFYDRQVILALDLATEKFLAWYNNPFDPWGGGSSLVGGCSCRYDAGIAAGSQDSISCTEVELNEDEAEGRRFTCLCFNQSYSVSYDS